MRPKKNKGPLRNYHFLKEADEALMELVEKTGRVQVVVLEDLLLQQRQFGPLIEQFLADESKRTGKSRAQLIEAALLDRMSRALGSSLAPGSAETGAPSPSDDELATVVVPTVSSQSRGSKPRFKRQTKPLLIPK
ncbi:MAG: hypothetical protein ABSE16_05540 [Verrucomicrobiota bacterium]|jgi:hypothetical protein